ncbi:MAG TPA: peptidylprolyl isomerase [Polyangiaceae bacterium]
MWPKQAWCMCVAGALVAGCGGSQPTAAAPKVDASASSAESECLDQANGEHPRKPDEPVRIGLRHILVRHVDSTRADASITRTRGEACLRAREALRALEAGTEWNDAVARFSDEKGAATRHGSLGSLTRDDLDPAFADAAFELEADQLSYVVESPAGFHVILRVD